MVSSLSPLGKIENYITAENFPELSTDWRNYLVLEATRMVQMKQALDAYSNYKPEADSFPITYREIAVIVKGQVKVDLAGKSDEEIKAETKRRFNQLLKDNPKAFTLTGHPTEVLSSTSVKARDNLRKQIAENWVELSSATAAAVPENIATGLQNLSHAIIKHPPKRKSMGQEQRDAKRASEKYFDAVFLEYEAAQDALEFVGCDTNIDDIDPLISVFSWVFDNDGKPELIPDEMRAALDLFKSAILAKYVKELATANTMLDGHDELQQKTLKLLFKLINSIRCEDPAKQAKGVDDIRQWAKELAKDNSTNPTAANMKAALKLFKDTGPIRENIAHADVPLNYDGYTPEAAARLRNLNSNIRTTHRTTLQEKIPTLDDNEHLHFESEENLCKEFAALRDEINASTAPEEAKHFIGKLTHGVKCFGLTAAKAEFRQSIEVYQLAHIKLQSLLQLPENVDAKNIQQLAEYLSDLKTNDPEQLQQIKQAIFAEIDEIKKQHWFMECREKLAISDIPKEHRSEYYFADLVEKLNLVSKHPKEAPIVLGAECNDENGAVLMAIMYTLSAATDKTVNTIMPLIEYKKAVERHEEITANLKANAAFMNLIDGKFDKMLAGSDASKTMGNAAAEYTVTGDYIGAGSGLQRNAIPMEDPAKVTEQGIKLGLTSKEEIAAGTQVTRAPRMAKSLGVAYKKTLTDAQVVVNIGNRLKLQPTANAKDDAKIKADKYEEFYNSAELSHYFQYFTQKDVEAKHSYAARPDVRPSYEYFENILKDIVRSIFGVRAIGHGRRGRAKFGTLILSAEAAESLGANEIGMFDEGKLDEAVAKYRSDPFCQHVINGAIDDIANVHAEKAGWAEVAKVLSAESGKNIKIRRHINDDGSITLQINNLKLDYKNILTPRNHDRAELISVIMKICGHKKESEELASGVIGAVMHDWEHIKSTRAITQVLGRMNGQVIPVTADPDILLQQLTKLNKAHGENLQKSRKIAEQAAESLVHSDDKSGAHACTALSAENAQTIYLFPQVSAGKSRP